ncbi:hypothetical protein [Telluria beijingensis]|uniref:hypothetical protein n=1 Tax=Telluria beijingensis TaxID=3068633 RepID=UPI0027955BE0|nr:hypothetical protein [Massilia sp. REN29]
MRSSSISGLRRRLCLTLPFGALAATLGGAAQALPRPPYQVAMSLDLLGETSKPVAHVFRGERAMISGMHGDTPWRLEFTIKHYDRREPMQVFTRLTVADDIVAAKTRHVNPGQRVVVRADDTMDVGLIIKIV